MAGVVGQPVAEGPARLGDWSPTTYTHWRPMSWFRRMAPNSFSRPATQNTGIERNRNPAKVRA
jgi:hypothetical protein